MSTVCSGHGRGQGERQPEHDVFEHGDAENEPRETGLQNVQVGENLRDHGNRRHRDAHRQNDDQREAVAVRARQHRPNQPWPQREPQQKRDAGSDHDQPAHFAAFFAAE